MTDHRSEPLPMRPSQPGPDEARYLFRAILARRLAIITLGVVLALVLVGIATMIFLLLQGQREAAVRGKDVVRTVDLIEDCTQPRGECFRAGEKRTAGAVTGINDGTMKIIVAALSCQVDGVTEERQLAVCTAQRASSPE